MDIFKRALLPAAAGWLAIDIYMSAVYLALGSTPLRLFQWDASNVLGNAAYSGGWAAGTLGLVLDFIVSFAWAVLAVYAMQHLTAARSHPVAFGIALGILVMCVMVYGLVPLGHARQAPFTLRGFLIMLFGHTLFFGVPLTLSFRVKRGHVAGMAYERLVD